MRLVEFFVLHLFSSFWSIVGKDMEFFFEMDIIPKLPSKEVYA